MTGLNEKWHAKESKIIEKDKIMRRAWARARASANANARMIQMKTRQKWASHKNEFVLLSINFWFESLSDMPTVNIFFLSEFCFSSVSSSHIDASYVIYSSSSSRFGYNFMKAICSVHTHTHTYFCALWIILFWSKPKCRRK